MNKQEYIQYVSEHRNELERCPICGSNIADRTVTLYKELINDLYRVYKKCVISENHCFKMKDIKDILDKNNYARFGDLCRFGGIVYKLAKGNYGLNMERCKAFFEGTYKIPVQITLNQIDNTIVDKVEVDISHFPELKQLLSNDGVYDYKSKLFN